MPESPNPFEPPPAFPLEPNQTGYEQLQRFRHVVSMWICAIAGIVTMPTFPLIPYLVQILDGSATGQRDSISVWIAPFACGIASAVNAVCLFRLPRITDKIGALAAIILVGFLPVFSAVYAWSVILFPWNSHR